MKRIRPERKNPTRKGTARIRECKNEGCDDLREVANARCKKCKGPGRKKVSIEQFFAQQYSNGVREITLTTEQVIQLGKFRANSPVMMPVDHAEFCGIKIKNFIK